MKDSQQRDFLISSATASPCNYEVELPCTDRFAQWCERLSLMKKTSYSILDRGAKRAWRDMEFAAGKNHLYIISSLRR